MKLPGFICRKIFLISICLLASVIFSSAQSLVLINNLGANITTNMFINGGPTGLTSGSGGQYFFALYYSTNATTVNGQATALVGNTNNNYAFDNTNFWKLAAYATNIATPGRFLSTSRNASGYTTVPGVEAGATAQFVVIGWSANLGTDIAAVQAWFHGSGSFSEGWIGQSAVSGSLLVGGDGNGFSYPPTSLFGSGARIPAFTLGRATPGLFSPPYVISQAANQTIGTGGTAIFSVIATGDVSLLMAGQWRLNGTNLSLGGNYAVTSTNIADYFLFTRHAVFTLTVTNAQSTNAGDYSVIISNNAGSVISSNATLTLQNGPGQPPVIAAQPNDVTVVAGSNVTFSATVNGTAPLAYQWSFNNTNLLGATNASLILTGVQPVNAGNYSVSITNAYGSTNSAAAVLTVQTFPPFITQQPAGLSVQIGSSAAFSVTATGTAPLAYQWTFNGTNLSGANSASLNLANVLVNNAGSYAVTITSPYGMTNSADAMLSVTSQLNYGYIIFANSAVSSTKMFTNSSVGGAPTGLTSSNSLTYRFALFASTNAASVNGVTDAILGAASNYVFNDPAWTLAAYGTNIFAPGRMRSAQANGSGFTPVPIQGSAGVMSRFVLIGWSAGLGTNVAAVQAWFNGGNPLTDGWIGQSAVSGQIFMGDGGSLPPGVVFGAGAQQLHGFTLGLASANPLANYPPPYVPPPVLSTKVEGSLLKLSWPVFYASYGVQSCTQIGGTWDDVAGTPVSDGTNWSLSLPLANQQPFYRLIVQ